MKNLTDECLVALFAQGTNEAFDELLCRYKDKLYTYILGAVQSREQAEDIFQDTFTKTIVTIKSGRYTERGRFSSFLYRVAHNCVTDVYRKEQQMLVVNESDCDYDIFGKKNVIEQSEQSREDKIAYRQILADIRRMIAFLPAEQRQIITMRYYKNMQFNEIAEVLGISINTALGRVHYALINLRKLSEKHHISLAI
ncbi:MAG: sigma-70 family RNA polymerase sigma factor [Bacteroidales bacterium]|nr:sigma-70 family RNA polymerase sigma factor [Bacteroidales bacterium]